MELLNFINQNATALMILLNFAVFVGVLYLSTKFAPKSLEGAVLKLEGRVTILENLPDPVRLKDDVHLLEISITNLNGKIESLGEKLGGLEDLIERLETQGDRINTYLLRTTK